MRAFGGIIYLSGALLMVYNLLMTTKGVSITANEEASAPAIELKERKKAGEKWHSVLERTPVRLTILALIAILIGTIVEMVPTFLVKSNVPTIASVKPYTPLELIGRDIYIREGCYTCHSQMIRPFRSETERYGEYSKAGEFVYDHPFQWGSKRTGPDLAREGVITGRQYKPAAWHYNHMEDPQKVNSESLMPKFPWLITDDMDLTSLSKKIDAMITLGVPYPEGYDKQAEADLETQAAKIVDDLKSQGVVVSPKKEIVALIAYLQRLGTDITKADKEQTATSTGE